jgi:hypothetical protein
MLMELTPDQRDRIRLLLEQELQEASRSAIGRGVQPAEVAAFLADRRRALEDLATGFADDPQHPVDDTGEGSGIGQQR